MSTSFDGSTKPDAIAGESLTDVQHQEAMWSDMTAALDTYTAAHPTTAAMTTSAGAVAMQVFEKLKAEGFSLLEILPKLFAIVSLIQKYGSDIMAMVEEFKRIFGGPANA